MAAFEAADLDVSDELMGDEQEHASDDDEEEHCFNSKMGIS
jgi:hypothetical protein